MDEDKDDMFRWLAGGKYRRRSAFDNAKMINDYRNSIKKQFVTKFEDELNNCINGELGAEWSLSVDEDIFYKNQKFKISKSSWSDRYYIALSNELGSFNGIFYGLHGWHESITEEERALQTIMNENIGLTRKIEDSNDNYIWARDVDVCHELVHNIDNIIRLLENNRGAVIESWTNQLIRLARLVEPHIDRICKN